MRRSPRLLQQHLSTFSCQLPSVHSCQLKNFNSWMSTESIIAVYKIDQQLLRTKLVHLRCRKHRKRANPQFWEKSQLWRNCHGTKADSPSGSCSFGSPISGLESKEERRRNTNPCVIKSCRIIFLQILRNKQEGRKGNFGIAEWVTVEGKVDPFAGKVD